MEAKVRLVIDGKEFHAKMILAAEDLKKVRAEAESVEHKVANWGMAVTGINSALQVLSSQIIPLISQPFEKAGQMEQYSVALKVMLGDAELAKKRLEELVEFAARTPFELPQVVEAGNKLQALGRYSLENLQMLGDLASASGKPFEQALSAYAKLVSGQKGIAIDMFRDLLVTTNDWAEATGKGFAKSGEFLGDYEEMLAALPEIIKKKGFAGMMDEQSKTLLGKLSNMKDAVGQTMAEVGEAILPAAKFMLDAAVPALNSLKDNAQTVGPVIAGLTLSVILYTTALKAQTLAENISTMSLKNSVVAQVAKNIQVRLTNSVQTLATASTLAYGVAHDVLSGKISVSTGTTQLFKLMTMSLGSVLTLAGASLGVLTASWGVYEITVGKSRREMVETEKETERLRLGMKEMQRTLDTMNSSTLENELINIQDQIKKTKNDIVALQNLSGLTPTGIPFIDAILTRGLSDAIYDQIDAQKGQIEVMNDYNKELENYKKKVTEAKQFTDNYNQSTLKSLITINQIREAREKALLAQGRAETDPERQRIAAIIEDLDKLEAKYKSGKDTTKKTYEQMVTDKINFYEDLAKLDKTSLSQYQSYLNSQLDYYNKTLLAEKGSFENFTAEQLKSYNLIKQKLQEIKETIKPPEIDLGEIEMEDIEFDADKVQKDMEKLKQLRLDAIRDSNQRALQELENWYSEQKELDLYNENAEAKLLIDQQYANRKKEIMTEMFQGEADKIREITGMSKSILLEISDLEKSGAEKRKSILENLYRSGVDLLLRYLEEFIIKKSAELAVHTATETAKTSVTIAQSAIRAGTEREEASAAAGSGGGGIFSTIFSFVGSLFSFLGLKKGGAIIGENGPELVAPIETYVDANKNLVAKTVLAVENSLKESQLRNTTALLNTKVLEDLMKKHIESIDKWRSKFVFALNKGDLKTAMDSVNSYYEKFEVG